MSILKDYTKIAVPTENSYFTDYSYRVTDAEIDSDTLIRYDGTRTIDSLGHVVLTELPKIIGYVGDDKGTCNIYLRYGDTNPIVEMDVDAVNKFYLPDFGLFNISEMISSDVDVLFDRDYNGGEAWEVEDISDARYDYLLSEVIKGYLDYFQNTLEEYGKVNHDLY